MGGNNQGGGMDGGQQQSSSSSGGGFGGPLQGAETAGVMGIINNGKSSLKSVVVVVTDGEK
jgi:hypothetical protein